MGEVVALKVKNKPKQPSKKAVTICVGSTVGLRVEGNTSYPVLDPALFKVKVQ